MSIPSVGFQKKKEPRRSPRRSLLGGIRWTEAVSVSCFRGGLRELRGKAVSNATPKLTDAESLGRPRPYFLAIDFFFAGALDDRDDDFALVELVARADDDRATISD